MPRIMCQIIGSFVLAIAITGCAGSTLWAKHANEVDIREASDFDLCYRFLGTNEVNAGIGSEIIRRGLLTKDESETLLANGWKAVPAIYIGEKKCLAFMGPNWKEGSQVVATDGHSIEIWKELHCEPTIFTLLGLLCSYDEITFENNLVTRIERNK